MTEEDVRLIVREEIRTGIPAAMMLTLQTLGIEADDPLEVQRDFQHLRAWREGTQAVKRNAILAIVTVVIPGLLWLVWSNLKGG